MAGPRAGSRSSTPVPYNVSVMFLGERAGRQLVSDSDGHWALDTTDAAAGYPPVQLPVGLGGSDAGSCRVPRVELAVSVLAVDVRDCLRRPHGSLQRVRWPRSTTSTAGPRSSPRLLAHSPFHFKFHRSLSPISRTRSRPPSSMLPVDRDKQARGDGGEGTRSPRCAWFVVT